MSGSVRWVAVVLAATLGACSGRLEHEIEAFEQGASARPGNTGGNAGSTGAGGNAGSTGNATPPAGGGSSPAPSVTGGAPAGAAGAAGSGGGGAGGEMMPGTGGTGGAGGGMAAMPPARMDGGAFRDSGGAPDARPATPPPSSSTGCAPGLDALAIMVRKCGNCHGERTPTKGLDLVTPGIATRLVGVRSGCQARPFLDPMPGAPESYFLEKLDRAVAGCGVQMPFGAPPLSADERACLQDWAEKAIARGVSGR